MCCDIMGKFKVGDYITKVANNRSEIIWKIDRITYNNYHTLFITSECHYYPLTEGYTWNHYMPHADNHFRKLSEAEVLAKVI